MTKVALETLNRMPPSEFIAALGGIFEHSPWVAEAVADRRPFATLQDLHDAMAAVVGEATQEQKLKLLRSHPDLAGKAARAGAMTADSVLEQGSAGLDRLTEDEFARFHHLNSAYQAKFGFPFILCVRRHTKDSILRQFALRLGNDVAREHEAALSEIFRITALRLDQHVDAPDVLKVHGFLDVHVIDTVKGEPAKGMLVELHEISGAAAWKRAESRIDARGLSETPLIEGRPIPIGEYELRFFAGTYFRAQRGGDAFFDVIPIRFSIAEPEGAYHIPLRVTPWAYTVYRGQ